MVEQFENIAILRSNIRDFDSAEEAATVDITLKDGTKHSADERYKGIWNTTNKSLSCIASHKYKIIQHEAAFNEVINVLQGMKIDGTGFLKNNHDVVTIEMAFFDYKIEAAEGDIINLGIRISNSYDSSKSFSGEVFAFRGMCSNGMFLGKVFHEIKLRKHHMGVIELKKLVVDFIKKVVDSYDALKDYIQIAMDDEYEGVHALRVVEELVTIKKYREAILKRIDLTKKITRWDVYNAVTNVASHTEDISEGARTILQVVSQKILINDFKLDNESESKKQKRLASFNK